jgi:hypothetical protein
MPSWSAAHASNGVPIAEAGPWNASVRGGRTGNGASTVPGARNRHDHMGLAHPGSVRNGPGTTSVSTRQSLEAPPCGQRSPRHPIYCAGTRTGSCVHLHHLITDLEAVRNSPGTITSRPSWRTLRDGTQQLGRARHPPRDHCARRVAGGSATAQIIQLRTTKQHRTQEGRHRVDRRLRARIGGSDSIALRNHAKRRRAGPRCTRCFQGR